VSSAYKIFLNVNRGDLLNYQSQYFVDSLSFFGLGHHPHESAAAPPLMSAENRRSDINDIVSQLIANGFSYDITDVVFRLSANHRWNGDQLAVTFAPPAADDCASASDAPADARARFTRVTLKVH